MASGGKRSGGRCGAFGTAVTAGLRGAGAGAGFGATASGGFGTVVDAFFGGTFFGGAFLVWVFFVGLFFVAARGCFERAGFLRLWLRVCAAFFVRAADFLSF